jgi:hypothetical protein
LGMGGERIVSVVFCLFCIDFCALKYHDLDLAISQLLLVQSAPSFGCNLDI